MSTLSDDIIPPPLRRFLVPVSLMQHEQYYDIRGPCFATYFGGACAVPAGSSSASSPWSLALPKSASAKGLP